MKKLYKEGLTVAALIQKLKELPKNIPLLVASDEEKNTVYKGFYIEEFSDGVIIAGLDGLEF